MKLADTNVWLALTLSKHVFHDVAHNWLAAQTLPGDIGFCRATQQSLLRLLTTEAVLNRYGSAPLTNSEAWTVYESLLADQRVSFLDEPAGLESHWKQLAVRKESSPKLWMDAYLAAFAVAAGLQFVTTDHAFTQHAGLDVVVLS
jgi:toxin-antitoxin system PIN domain toxin